MTDMLYVLPVGGLGNRLLATLSGCRFAKLTERSLGVLWFATDECFCEWSDLFKSEILIKSRQTAKHTLIDRSFDAYERRHAGQPLAPLSKEGDLYILSNTVFLRDTEARQRFRHDGYELLNFANCLTDLQPVDSIVNHVADYAADKDFSNCIGLHIRRGYRDEKFDLSWINSVSLDFYKSTADRAIRSGYRVHVCSDDERITELFSKEFNATSFPVASREKNQDATAIQDALKDMLIMSKCKYIISLHGSTFGYLSAILGKTSLVCIRHNNDGVLTVDRAVNFGEYNRAGRALVSDFSLTA